MSWARLSLRALNLDRESRREASSALSLVRESSSCARPASAYGGNREADVREKSREADADKLGRGQGDRVERSQVIPSKKATDWDTVSKTPHTLEPLKKGP